MYSAHRLRAQLHSKYNRRGGEWYLENRGSRRLFIQSRNLGILYVIKSLAVSFLVHLFRSRNLEFFYRSSRSLRFDIIAESLGQKIARVA